MWTIDKGGNYTESSTSQKFMCRYKDVIEEMLGRKLKDREDILNLYYTILPCGSPFYKPLLENLSHENLKPSVQNCFTSVACALDEAGDISYRRGTFFTAHRSVLMYLFDKTFRGLASDPKKVKYLNEKGRIQETKVGRYLKKIFPDVTEKELVSFSEAWQNQIVSPRLPAVYHTTVWQIDKVYEMKSANSFSLDTTGMVKLLNDSCMQSRFSGQDHPASAYNSGDFECHYLTDEEEKLLYARSVVYKGNKHAGPIYATSENKAEELHKYMTEAGVKIHEELDDVSWEGSRFELIEHPNNDGEFDSEGHPLLIIAPYLDLFCDGFKIDGFHLTPNYGTSRSKDYTSNYHSGSQERV